MIADIYILKTKYVIHHPVKCLLSWKKTYRSREKWECLKKLPCEILVIAFSGNKFCSNHLPCQKKLEEGSDETFAWNLCLHSNWELKDHAKSPTLYSCSLLLKMQDARNKQKKQKTSKESAVRFLQKLVYHSLRFIVFCGLSF